jgi:hypothetical protein
MKINRLHEQVWEVQDFLTPYEINAYMEIINSCPDGGWNESPDTTPLWWQGRSLILWQKKYYEVESVTYAIQDRLEDFFENYTKIHQVSHILRARQGEGMGVHRDDVEPPDKVNVFGLVLYLNDDYEGGEIIYPEIDLEHKPKAGSLVVHSASLPHGVNEVKNSKVRYVLTSFVKGDSTTRIRENNAI